MPTLPSPSEISYMMQHPDDNNTSFLMTPSCITFSFACLAVGLRFLSRRLAKTKVQIDDILIVVGLVFTFAAGTCLIQSTRYGMGRHVVFVTDVKTVKILASACQALYSPSFVAIKLSILFLYRRLFPLPEFHRYLLATGIFVIATGIFCFLLVPLQCIPFEASWNPLMKGRCVNKPVAIVIISVINLLTDYWILVLPMPILWSMTLTFNQKVSLVGIFLLGGGTCVTVTLRAFYVKEMTATSDPTYAGAKGFVTSGLELTIGIISACLPTYRPLFRRVKAALSRGSEEESPPEQRNDSTPRNESNIRHQISFQLRSFPAKLTGPAK